MIKILFLGANPTGTTQLALTQEVQAIKEHLRSADHGRHFQVEQEWAVKISALNAALLRHKPDIVHFSGHGSPAGELVLETESGTATSVKPETLTNLFKILKRNIRCVVLNACFSAPQAGAIAQHIDCVVGMTRAVGDEGAIAFAWAFYEALAFNVSVQEAFDLGCNQIDMNRLPDKDTPKLVLRAGVNPAEVHLLPSEGSASPAAGNPPGTTQQGGTTYTYNVAITGGSHGAVAVGPGATAHGNVSVGERGQQAAPLMRLESTATAHPGAQPQAIAAPATGTWELTLDVDFTKLDQIKLATILDRVRELTGYDDISLVGKRPGSVVVVLRGSREAYAVLAALHKEGQFREVAGVPVLGLKWVDDVKAPPSQPTPDQHEEGEMPRALELSTAHGRGNRFTHGFYGGSGAVLLVLILVLCFPNPTPAQWTTFRIVIALGGAGYALALAGFLTVKMAWERRISISAGGTLAVFAVLLFFDPVKSVFARLPATSPGRAGVTVIPTVSTSSRPAVERDLPAIDSGPRLPLPTTDPEPTQKPSNSRQQRCYRRGERLTSSGVSCTVESIQANYAVLTMSGPQGEKTHDVDVYVNQAARLATTDGEHECRVTAIVKECVYLTIPTRSK